MSPCLDRRLFPCLFCPQEPRLSIRDNPLSEPNRIAREEVIIDEIFTHREGVVFCVLLCRRNNASCLGRARYFWCSCRRQDRAAPRVPSRYPCRETGDKLSLLSYLCATQHGIRHSTTAEMHRLPSKHSFSKRQAAHQAIIRVLGKEGTDPLQESA